MSISKEDLKKLQDQAKEIRGMCTYISNKITSEMASIDDDQASYERGVAAEKERVAQIIHLFPLNPEIVIERIKQGGEPMDEDYLEKEHGEDVRKIMKDREAVK